MSPRDIGLFLRSAQTDSGIAKNRVENGDIAAFDAAYASGDPWASGDRRYLYQRRKYDVLVGLLPVDQRFENVLDIGSGLGLLCRRLADRADRVTGIDISDEAITQAKSIYLDINNIFFEQGDIRDISAEKDGLYDLVVLVDTLYYLPKPITDAMLKSIALRVSALLVPGGTCLLANHFFFSADPDSRLSRRIHRAFAWSPGFKVVSEYRRPFYLVSILGTTEPNQHANKNHHRAVLTQFAKSTSPIAHRYQFNWGAFALERRI